MIALILSLTLGHPDYQVRLGSTRVARAHPLLAHVVSVVAHYSPDLEVRKAGRRLWNPRLSDCFFLSKADLSDTIPGEAHEAAIRLGLDMPWDDIGYFYPGPPDYKDRLEVKCRALKVLPLTVSVK